MLYIQCSSRYTPIYHYLFYHIVFTIYLNQNCCEHIELPFAVLPFNPDVLEYPPPNLRENNLRPSEKCLPRALPMIIPPSEEKLLWLRLSSFKTLSPFKKNDQDIVIFYTHICLHYNTTTKLIVAKWKKNPQLRHFYSYLCHIKRWDF